MGRTGRAVCVAIPMLATAATIALIVISTFIGQTNVGNSFLNDLYFVRLDTRYIEAPSRLGPDIPGTQFEDFIFDRVGVDLQIENTANLVGAADFYQAGLFSYCSGTYDNITDVWQVRNCSEPSGSFYFNIIDIINAEVNSDKNVTFPDSVNTFFKAVKALTRAQFVCFIFGIGATALEFILGWFGFLSRWGSCVTTFIAVFAFWALLAASAINIGLYITLSKAFDASAGTFGVRGAINRRVYILMFIGVACSFGAMLFWTLSTCCCSGRRDRIMKDERTRSGSPVKGYERVTSPYMGGGGPAPPPPHQQYGQTYGSKPEGPYEPLRHTQV